MDSPPRALALGLYGAELLSSWISGSLRRMTQVTQILEAVEHGTEDSATRLLPLVYDELRALAAARMAQEPAGHTLQPTALVHEAWLRLIGSEAATWQNRGHFFAAAAEAMRRILIERARRKARLKRAGDRQRVNIDDVELTAEAPSDDHLLLVDESLARLKEHDPEKAQVVLLKFIGGLTNREVADSMGVAERTVERQWAFAKAWLFRDMQKETGL